MRGRGILAKLGLVLGTGTVFAQPPGYPQPPVLPQPPGYPLPPVFPTQAPQTQPPVIPPAPTFPMPLMPQRPSFPPGQSPQSPAGQQPGILPPLRPGGLASPTQNPVAMPQEFPLPQKENKLVVNPADVSIKLVGGAWQLWAGRQLLRDFGDNEKSARAAATVFRDLRPTEWIAIGGPKPVVEYGLVHGRAPLVAGASDANREESKDASQSSGGFAGAGGFIGPAATGAGASQIVPIDLRSVRVEAIRGAWCLRDDFNIHFNFGPVKADAEQAAAVVLRYGFNRVGIVGTPAPAMHYLFSAPDATAPPQPQGRFAKLQLQQQIDSLTRVGIPVGGVGYVGEMIPFDPRKLAVRKEGYEWVVAAGTEVIARFGPTEWAARDAMRTMQESQFTEFCKVGSAGLTFFLSNGKAPTRVPLADQGKRYDLNSLHVKPFGKKWAVTENGRFLLECATAEEGETLIRVLKHYQFDQLCHLGPTPRLGVSYLAKTGR